MNFKIVISDKIAKDQTSLLYLQFYYHSKKYLISINIRCERELFDKKTQMIKKIHPLADDYNLLINQAKAKINEILIKYRMYDKELTPNLIKKEYHNPASGYEFFPWVIREIASRSEGVISEATAKGQFSIMHKFNDFAKAVRFAEIDTDMINEFEKYMIKKGNGISTRENAHKKLKSYIKIAVDRKLMVNNPYKGWKIKKKNINDRLYLTFDERQKLIDLYNRCELTEKHQKVLRGFLFSCFTGLRFSDMISLKKSNIMDNTIILMMKKTKRINESIVKIPISGMALKLINDSPVEIYGAIFKSYSEQKTNEALKLIAIKAKINKKITTHVARHTFATLFFEKTKDIVSLQKLLGHSNIRETMIYAHISEELINEQMKKFYE